MIALMEPWKLARWLERFFGMSAAKPRAGESPRAGRLVDFAAIAPRAGRLTSVRALVTAGRFLLEPLGVSHLAGRSETALRAPVILAALLGLAARGEIDLLASSRP